MVFFLWLTFGLDCSKHVKTPESSTVILIKYEKSENINSKVYKSMIDSLLYHTASWPTICFSVRLCKVLVESYGITYYN